MPRRKVEPWAARAKQLNQEAADRRQREAILASQAAAAATPEPDLPPPAAAEPPDEPEGFNPEAWQRNNRICGLMRARFGPNWATSPRLERLAQRALADLNGSDSGKAIRHLRYHATNGTYLSAIQAKFGLLEHEVPLRP